MGLVLNPDQTDIETSNENIIGIGLHVFETNMPDGAIWTAGLTVEVAIQSPYPGDEDEWEALHTFTEKGTKSINLIDGRIYRVVASVKGPWVYLNIIKVRAT